MRNRRRIAYTKALVFSLGITLSIHFFVLLLVAGYNAFNSPFVIPFDTNQLRPTMLFFSFGSLFMFMFVQFLILFKIQGTSLRFKFGWIILGVLAMASMYGVLVMYIYHTAYSLDAELSFRIYMGSLVGNGVLSVMVIIIGYLDFLTGKQQRIALENESLKSQTLQSRYEALKNQIDPHFLFNTFSSLTSMIELDPSRAQEFSIKMSSVIRYTLQSKDVVTLADEMEFTRNYCLLMQIRYGENLKFNFDIDPYFEKYSVAPLSIQTLIENAVKHNEISNRSPLTVSVHTNQDATLTVSNPINPKRDPAGGTGLGLANLSERYQLKFKREIKIFSNEKVFMVTIPLILKSK